MRGVPAAAPVTSEEVRLLVRPEDFEGIVRGHQRRIYRILLLFLHDPDEADNLTQECFVRAFLGRRSFRGEACLATWLIRIAINLAHDELKSRRASFWRRLLRGKEGDALALPDRRPNPEASMLTREEVVGVWSAVEELPMRQRTAFLLRFGADMKLREIARAMGLREGTVKAHLSHAVEAIRRRLGR